MLPGLRVLDTKRSVEKGQILRLLYFCFTKYYAVFVPGWQEKTSH